MARKLCDVNVSDFGLGTWGFGGGSTRDTTNDEKDLRSIGYALDCGINVIDTAEMYASGHTEELVGSAISKRNREDLFLITKVWPTHLKRDELKKAASQSLKRLGTHYIDLYLVHWPSDKVPIEETIHAMEELVEEGKVRNIGVSNFDTGQLEDAMSACRNASISANQVEYSYGKREAEKDIIPFCERNRVSVIAYTPIMKGRTEGFSSLSKIGEKMGLNSVQVSLLYVRKQSYPIPKVGRKEHLDELLYASGKELSESDFRELNLSR